MCCLMEGRGVRQTDRQRDRRSAARNVAPTDRWLSMTRIAFFVKRFQFHCTLNILWQYPQQTVENSIRKTRCTIITRFCSLYNVESFAMFINTILVSIFHSQSRDFLCSNAQVQSPFRFPWTSPRNWFRHQNITESDSRFLTEQPCRM